LVPVRTDRAACFFSRKKWPINFQEIQKKGFKCPKLGFSEKCGKKKGDVITIWARFGIPFCTSIIQTESQNPNSSEFIRQDVGHFGTKPAQILMKVKVRCIVYNLK